MLSGVWEPMEPSCCLSSAMTSCAPLALTFLLCCLHMPTYQGPSLRKLPLAWRSPGCCPIPGRGLVPVANATPSYPT